MEVVRQGREVVVTLDSAKAAQRLADALTEDAVRTLEVVGAARDQGEDAQWQVVWKEGEPWPCGGKYASNA